MTVKAESVILTSRPFPGNIPSSRIGNIAWSDDGQCLFVTRKGVNIMVGDVFSFDSPYVYERACLDSTLDFLYHSANPTDARSVSRVLDCCDQPNQTEI